MAGGLKAEFKEDLPKPVGTEVYRLTFPGLVARGSGNSKFLLGRGDLFINLGMSLEEPSLKNRNIHIHGILFTDLGGFFF